MLLLIVYCKIILCSSRGPHYQRTKRLTPRTSVLRSSSTMPPPKSPMPDIYINMDPSRHCVSDVAVNGKRLASLRGRFGSGREREKVSSLYSMNDSDLDRIEVRGGGRGECNQREKRDYFRLGATRNAKPSFTHCTVLCSNFIIFLSKCCNSLFGYSPLPREECGFHLEESCLVDIGLTQLVGHRAGAVRGVCLDET